MIRQFLPSDESRGGDGKGASGVLFVSFDGGLQQCRIIDGGGHGGDLDAESTTEKGVVL